MAFDDCRLSMGDIAQHVAAGMLLLSFEVHQGSCLSGQWLGYLTRVEAVIRQAMPSTPHDHDRLDDGDVATLMDWVHYHAVLARFSLSHWKRPPDSKLPSAEALIAFKASPAGFQSLRKQGAGLKDIRHQELRLNPPANSVLELLAQVNELERMSPVNSCDNYRAFWERLDWRVRAVLPSEVSDHLGQSASDHDTLLAELYKIALLVYLDRVSEGIVDHPLKTQALIDRAFAILSSAEFQGYCKQQFPIFIIGCEAKTDERRSLILDIISRTERMACSRVWLHCRELTQAIWVQDDLSAGDEDGQRSVDYRDKMQAVFGLCRILPSFV
jgi:hypothetical protein